MKKEEHSEDTDPSKETGEVIQDWSNIDATSIYRAGSSTPPADKKELDGLIEETNNFFKVGLLLFAVVIIVVVISSYY